MDSRALNCRGTIKAPPTAVDDAGQPTGAWTTVCTTWANIRYLSGVESIKAGAETSVTKASIRIRRRSGITSAMRFEYGGTVFQILSVQPDLIDKTKMDLVCQVVL